MANWRRDVRMVIPPGSPLSQRLIIGDALLSTLKEERDAYWENRKSMEQKIMEGEVEQASVVAEAWSYVYQANVDAWNATEGKIKNVMESIGKSIGTTLISNMVQLMSTTDNWAEKFKQAGVSILQTIAQIIVQTALMNALFGNTKGEYQSGSGILGAVGGIVKSIFFAQEGGVVDKPSLIMAGEGGEEAFVPLKGGKIPVEGGGGGTTIINVYNVSAMDAKSMDDVFRRNSGSIQRSNQGSARLGGAFRKSVRGY